MGLFKRWKPKTKLGKVLKGVTIGAVGAAAIATGVGAIAGAAGGIGIFAGASKGIGTLVRTIGGGSKIVGSKISASAAKLLTGQTKEQNAIINQVKSEAKTAAQTQDAVKKLMNLGLTETIARQKLGLSALVDTVIPDTDDLGFLGKLRETFTGEQPPPPEEKDNKLIIYAGLGLLGLFLLPKILK